MKKRVFLMALAVLLLVGMAVPAMAETWLSYQNKTVSSGNSIAATGTITKVNKDMNYATFRNAETYAQHNPSFKTSITMRAWAGSSGTNVAASATVSSGGQKNGTFGTGYGGVGTSYRLGLFNGSADTVTSSGRWTPH